MRAGRIAGLTATLVLGAAGAASAAEVDVGVSPSDAALGTLHTASGQMRDDAGAALAGRRISLQVRPFPFTGAWRTVDHATTDAKGRYAIDDVELDRNTDLRVVAFDGTASGIARAFTYPAHRLAYKVVGKRRIRLTQTYRTPRDVRLRRRTLFYVGSGSATSARVSARGKTKRLRAGRFRSVVTVTLPRAFRGRFQYASCFAYTPGSGMGDPARGCPKRYAF
ncbi:MAG: hypothetical protein QOK21_1902 [Solirubrobacteraceae bacterium]|nr:hypothetical protein [Solirubrobacteraceae bacterium]